MNLCSSSRNRFMSYALKGVTEAPREALTECKVERHKCDRIVCECEAPRVQFISRKSSGTRESHICVQSVKKVQ